MKKKHVSFDKRNARQGLLFVAPWIFGCLILFVYPVINSIMLSFGDPSVKNVFKPSFGGLVNYKKAFLEDVQFIPNFLYSVQSLLLTLPLIIAFSLFVAVLLNRKMKFRGLFREIYFFPVLLGTGFIMQQLLKQGIDVEAMSLARQILLPEELMVYLGPKLSEAINTFLNTITVIFWKSGVQIILFLSGLQGIPGSLYEAAYVDGTTEWEKFWKITLPMMAPTILLVVVFTMVDSFTDVGNPMLNYIMIVMLRLANFQYAAAIGWIYFAFILLLIGIVFLVMRPFIRKVSD